MDIILLGVTIVSLIVAFVMSMMAMRLSREEKQRAAARVAALSVAAEAPDAQAAVSAPIAKAPWSAPKTVPSIVASARADSREPWRDAPIVTATAPSEIPLNAPSFPSERFMTPDAGVTHASGFLGATAIEPDRGGAQKTLAFAALALFVVLSGGLAWMMSGPRGSTAQAVGPNSPLELVSLTHQRQDSKLAVSGLVRNPVAGKPIDHLSAVVFLFDRSGAFVTSSRAKVDFLKLGAGDESPFVVSLDAPQSVTRYRVSFRTDEGVVPHIDRRSATPAPAEGEQTLNVSAK